MIHKVTSNVKRAKRMIKNESTRAVLMLLISLMLVPQVSFADTDLISAAGDGDLSQVMALVKEGSDVNHADKDGTTALYCDKKRPPRNSKVPDRKGSRRKSC